jgi:arylsulfatase A-like enzyme
VNGAREVAKEWTDDASATYAVRFMREQRAQPFYLFVGFKTPHRPWQPPKALAQKWAGAETRPVANLTARPPWRDPAAVPTGDADLPDDAPAKDGRPRLKEDQLDYFRCLAAMDASVGTVLAGIDDLGLRDSTLVLFLSDNGHFKGEHGLGDKRAAYEESIRIPLIARWPGRIPAGSTPTAPILSVDLPATACALAGVTPPVPLHGRDALGVFAGTPPADWRSAWLYTYWTDIEFPDTPAHVAVRTDRAKLIVYRDHPEWTELFDLKADPLELRNLAADPAHGALRAELEAELKRQQEAVAFRTPDGWPKKTRPRR